QVGPTSLHAGEGGAPATEGTSDQRRKDAGDLLSDAR
ncbi:MAG: hypothetical protein RLZZ622_1733, partial [Planctomycetota bacterium]